MTIAKPPIVSDVADIVGEYGEKVENRSLLLDKYVLHKSWPMVYSEVTGNPLKLDDATRWSFIRIAQNGEAILDAEKKRCRHDAGSPNPAKAEKARIMAMIAERMTICACRQLPSALQRQKLEQNKQFASALAHRSFGCQAIVYGELGGRLIVNQSDSLVQNAGICLDRMTGLPYIPGSAVKGVTRHVALGKLYGGEWTIAEFQRAFGSSEADFREDKKSGTKGDLAAFAEQIAKNDQTLKGGVDFLAAMPITEPKIVVDICTPHYAPDKEGPGYYGTGNPADLGRPNLRPNTFPVVESGVRYAFCIVGNGMPMEPRLFEKVRLALIEAITIHGIGAKTGAGYGWFRDVTVDVLSKLQKEELAAKERESRLQAEAAEAARRAEAKKEAARVAALTPQERLLEKWRAAPSLKSIVNGVDIARFADRSDSEKTAIAEALRSPDGIGADVWRVIKGITGDKKLDKLKNQKVESEIRAFYKNVLKLGKMP